VTPFNLGEMQDFAILIAAWHLWGTFCLAQDEWLAAAALARLDLLVP